MSTQDYKGTLHKHSNHFIFEKCISQLLLCYSAIATQKNSWDFEKKDCIAHFLCELWIGCGFAPVLFKVEAVSYLVHALGHLILMSEGKEQELLETYSVS